MPWDSWMPLALLSLVFGGIVGYIIGYRRRKPKIEQIIQDAKAKASNLIKQAETEAKRLQVEAKEEIVRLRDRAERDQDRKSVV